jgi:L-rhamnose mutarotase
LKPEFEERYIILHRHTFPGVLRRIYASNIRNYSIFLRDGILFSYYEYHAQNYEDDMKKIGEDPVTQDWWKLTDPMQEPIPDRKEGEWWVSMKEIGFYSDADFSGANIQRLAYQTEEESILMENINIPEDIIKEGFIHKLSVFYHGGRFYFYCEKEATASLSPVEKEKRILEPILSRITLDARMIHWGEMQEVFHTD